MCPAWFERKVGSEKLNTKSSACEKRNEDNKVFLAVVVKEVGKEIVTMGDISRPVVIASLYDSKKEIVDIRVVFSSLNDIRTHLKYKKGDVLYMIASIGEFPEDELIFYPEQIYRIKEGDDESMPELKIKMRLEQYTGVLNKVYFEGKVKKTFGSSSVLEVPISKFVRGEEFKPASIFVTHEEGYCQEGSKVFFQGEIRKKGLCGKIYKEDPTKRNPN